MANIGRRNSDLEVELLLDLTFKAGDQGDSLLSAWCVVDGSGEAMSLPLLLEVVWLGSAGLSY